MNKKSKAEQLLEDLDQGKSVSRWDVHIQRRSIRLFLREERFKHLEYKVQDLIDSAKESL